MFVSAQKLASEHPQWDDVRALDRQIAFIRGYGVREQQPVLVSSVRMPRLRPPESTTNVSVLEATIIKRLDSVYEIQKTALAERLSKQHRETRAAAVAADRNGIFAQADAEMKAILDESALKIRNLDIRLLAYDALVRSYAAQGWDSTALSLDRQKVADQVTAETDKTLARMRTVLRDGLRAKLGARADEETAATLKWMRENSQAQDDLDAEIARQKSLLFSALADIGRPPEVKPAVTGGQTAEPRAQVAVFPAVTQPQMQTILDSLIKRRMALARFLERNTQAIVRSAAARRGLNVEFVPRKGLPDKTDEFRDAVHSAPTRLLEKR